MQKIFFLSCFLIISSCDLPNEANKDCSGIQGGSAELDDCGICSGGETGITQNQDKDCLSECFGDAVLDECGECNGGNTSCLGCDGVPNSGLELDDCGVCGGSNVCDCPGYPEGTVMDCAGQCDGDAILDDCSICNGNNSTYGCDGQCLNHVEDACGVCDGPGVVDCMCESYITSNTDFNCETNGNSPYNIGDQLGCETLDEEFDICYPGDCGTIKLSDFENKVIFIIYEQDW